MWHVTHEMWHVTRDMWHFTCDTQGVVNIVSKCQVPSSKGLEVGCFEEMEEKGDLINEWINQSVTDVFVEQPRLHRVC